MLGLRVSFLITKVLEAGKEIVKRFGREDTFSTLSNPEGSDPEGSDNRICLAT